MLRTRPVDLEKDNSFLLEVYLSSRLHEVAHWGWSESDKLFFLQMQYRMQQQSYLLQYPAQSHQVIIADDAQAGRIITAQTEDAWVLVDITLLPPFRNRGIGSRLIQQLKEKAADSGMPVRLSVFNGNPAYRLYERLEFREVSRSELYTSMEWTS